MSYYSINYSGNLCCCLLKFNRYEKLLLHAKGNDKNRLINQIQVYALTEDRLMHIEENTKEWKQNGYSRDNFSYDVIFPQKLYAFSDNKNGIDKLSDKIQQKLAGKLKEENWIFVNSLKNILTEEKGYLPTDLRKSFKSAFKIVGTKKRKQKMSTKQDCQ